MSKPNSCPRCGGNRASLAPSNPKTAVPKRVLNLLERRSRLARELLSVCNQLNTYCEGIGMDVYGDPDACLGTDLRIYCEFDGAYSSTLSAIKKALGIPAENQQEKTKNG